MDKNLQVRLLQVDGDHPVSSKDGQENQQNGLHLEGDLADGAVQDREVDNMPLRPRSLPDDEHSVVKAWRRKRS